MSDLPPEVQAVIEDVLAWHQPKGPPWKDCFSCGRRYPCPTRTRLSALLPPPEPTVEVTDERAVALHLALFPNHRRADDCTFNGHREAQALIDAGLCPAAWLPEDERYKELREAATAVYNNLIPDGRKWDRLRAALQALDDTEAPK